MNLPKRRAKVRMHVRTSDKVKSPGHCRWVRTQFLCAIANKSGHVCEGIMECHHETSRGAGGGDEQVAPLCSGAHAEGHTGGWETFEKKYGVNLEKMAAELWREDKYHRGIWEQKMKESGG